MSCRARRAVVTVLGLALASTSSAALLTTPSGGNASAWAQEATPAPTPTTTAIVPTPKPTEQAPEPKPTTRPKPRPDSGGESVQPQPAPPSSTTTRSAPRRRVEPGLEMPPPLFSAFPYGPFSAQRLVRAERNLIELGWPAARARTVYQPFIIAGASDFANTWGALRRGPGPLLRRHLGQDVFCDGGDPVLASEPGKVEFGTSSLGGRFARLHLKQGGYYYYAHLSGWNKRKFSSGDRVRAGDVIGFCGNSGNAKTTPPHVHFGWYAGSAVDPMGQLIGWLDRAGARSRNMVARAQGKRVAHAYRHTMMRRFGLAFTPELKEPSTSADYALASRREDVRRH